MLRKYWMLLVLMLFVLSSTLVIGGLPSGATVEPKADQILRQMSKYLAGARQFSFESHKMVDFVLDSGQMIQLSDTARISVSRPNKIVARSSGDTNNEQIWYDGKTLSVLSPQQNTYATAKVPNTIDKMMDYLFEEFAVAVPIADLLVSDPYDSATQRVRSGQYIGLHQVQGTKCHHLAFRQNNVDWQIWIEEGDNPLPRKLVITHKGLPGHPQFIAIFDKWNLSPKLPDDLFSFKAPAGAKRVEIEPLLAKPALDKMLEEKPDAKPGLNK